MFVFIFFRFEKLPFYDSAFLGYSSLRLWSSHSNGQSRKELTRPSKYFLENEDRKSVAHGDSLTLPNRPLCWPCNVHMCVVYVKSYISKWSFIVWWDDQWRHSSCLELARLRSVDWSLSIFLLKDQPFVVTFTWYIYYSPEIAEVT